MTIQITVRLPDDLVAFLDANIAHEDRAGRRTSRATLIAKALAREKQRTDAERDAAIYATTGADPNLTGLAEYTAHRPMTDLD